LVFSFDYSAAEFFEESEDFKVIGYIGEGAINLVEASSDEFDSVSGSFSGRISQ